jgi:putative flippase GtrA
MSLNIIKKIKQEDGLFSRKTGAHFFGYALVGAITYALEIGMLTVFVEIFHFHYIVGTITSYSIGYALSFVGRKVFVFKKKGFEKIHRQVISSIIIFFIALGATSLFMTFFVEILKMHYIVAYVVSAIIVGTVAFLWDKHITFKS